MSAADNRFYVERVIGGRVTGTVSGSAYFRAIQHAEWAVNAGYSERVRVRGWLADGRQGDALSPVVYEIARECGCGCGNAFDRCAELVSAS